MRKINLGTARASSLQPNRIAPLLLAAMVSFGVGATGHYMLPGVGVAGATHGVVAAVMPAMQEVAASAPVQAVAAAAQEVHDFTQSAITAKPEAVTREVELGDKRDFAQMLTNSDVSPEDATAVAAAVAKVYEIRKLKAGQEVTLGLSRLGDNETLDSVTFQAESTKEVVVRRAENGAFTAQVNTTPIERQRLAARGEIRSTLYEAGERAGVPRAIMAGMLRAYAHNVDFQRDIHPGDKFEVLYDQPTAKDGSPAGQAVIVYAALQIKDVVKPLYRVTFGDGTVDYFDEKGKSVKRAFLRTPVEGARVTSRFGLRMHPILGYSKMHQGIDFGAAYGAPIFAASTGIVAEVGYKGAYGRYVRLRHGNRIDTAYAHMSRFGRGLYVGQRVNQGEVIGFVGSSGRSTGPHLHYEVHVNNRQVNPLSVNLPTGRILEGKLLSQFQDGQKKIKNEFSTLLSKSAQADQDEVPEAAPQDKPKLSITPASAQAPAPRAAKPTAS